MLHGRRHARQRPRSGRENEPWSSAARNTCTLSEVNAMVDLSEFLKKLTLYISLEHIKCGRWQLPTLFPACKAFDAAWCTSRWYN